MELKKQELPFSAPLPSSIAMVMNFWNKTTGGDILKRFYKFQEIELYPVIGPRIKRRKLLMKITKPRF